MTDGNDAPNVKIIPPLVYLAGIVIGFLAADDGRNRSQSEAGHGCSQMTNTSNARILIPLMSTAIATES
jgi:hypothetical protein